MKKVLFLIHDLGQGGAEKVLVNLVNNMDRAKFDISVTVLFGGGVNEQFLKPDIHFRAVFPKMIPANSHWMKLMSPEQLHKLCVKEHYDIEIAYLEGPAVRCISGCTHPDTKLVAWIHTHMSGMAQLAKPFRSEGEAKRCHGRFHLTACVSQVARDAFAEILPPAAPCQVYYNTVESDVILEKSKESVQLSGEGFKLVSTGSLKKVKAFDRLLRIQKRLKDEGVKSHLYILGEGPLRADLEAQTAELGISDTVTFLGYQTDPYKYVAKCDLFACSSFAEGFSTAATEALIVGTPVCTVEVSGMKEMLGDHNEYGVVTENDENALYRGIYDMLTVPGRLEHYKQQAAIRGRDFSTEETVRAVEEMLLSL